MVRRNHRSIYDEIDELKASMDYLFQLALEPADTSLLPEEETDKIACGYLHNINAEVTELDDIVTVTLDIIPGLDTTIISVDLVEPDTLKISCNRVEEESKENTGHSLREQRSFSVHHVIPLPVPVTKNGARSTLKNGILDLHLKKVPS